MSKSGVQMLLELQQLGAMLTALESLFHAHCSLVENLFLTPKPDLTVTQLHALPSGPVTAIRKQRSVLPLCSL